MTDTSAPIRLLVVVGSTRPSRVGHLVAGWIAETAAARDDMTVDLADLAEVALPFLDEPEHPRLGRYANAHTQGWSQRVGAADAVIFVFPEYNHGYPAPLKNAIDYLSAEWAYKPVALASYGGASGGTRAAAALAPVLAVLKMLPLAGNLAIANVGSMVQGEGDERAFHPSDTYRSMLDRTLGELARLVAPARALRP